jgi:hypothetical protein
MNFFRQLTALFAIWLLAISVVAGQNQQNQNTVASNAVFADNNPQDLSGPTSKDQVGRSCQKDAQGTLWCYAREERIGKHSIWPGGWVNGEDASRKAQLPGFAASFHMLDHLLGGPDCVNQIIRNLQSGTFRVGPAEAWAVRSIGLYRQPVEGKAGRPEYPVWTDHLIWPTTDSMIFMDLQPSNGCFLPGNQVERIGLSSRCFNVNILLASRPPAAVQPPPTPQQPPPPVQVPPPPTPRPVDCEYQPFEVKLSGGLLFSLPDGQSFVGGNILLSDGQKIPLIGWPNGSVAAPSLHIKSNVTGLVEWRQTDGNSYVTCRAAIELQKKHGHKKVFILVAIGAAVVACAFLCRFGGGEAGKTLGTRNGAR